MAEINEYEVSFGERIPKQPKILIVEDERLAAEDLSMRLSRLNYEIVGIASTSEDAVAMALAKQPNAILMDIQLRGRIDGIETSRRIHETYPVPVIFTTAFGDDEHVQRAMDVADPYGFLHKPIDEHAVSTLIKIALSRFANDQHILRINELLKIKNEVYTLLASSVDRDQVVTAISQAFSQSHAIGLFWMLCLADNYEVTGKKFTGLEAEQFEVYQRSFRVDLLEPSATLQADPEMSEIMGKQAYRIPILLAEVQIIGAIGMALEDPLTLDASEENILVDISLIISQKLKDFRLAEAQNMAQRMIEESEARLKAIVEKSTTGIYLVDSDFKFEYVNDRLCEILNRDRSELLGHPFPEFLGSSRELVIERYHARQNGQIVPGEYEIDVVRNSGEIRNLIISANAFKDSQGQMKSAGHLLDITDQKLANLQLSVLSKAIEQSPIMVVITDGDGNIEYVNSQFTQSMGYTMEEVKDQNPRILKSGELPESLYKDLWDTILSGETWSGELKNKKKNGDLTWEKASISPVRDADQNITHFVAVKEDISQQKREQAESLRNQVLRDVLYEITSMAIKTKSITELYEHIFLAIREIVTTSNFFMALLNKEAGTLSFPFERDSRESDLPDSIPFDPGTSLTAKTIVQGTTLMLKAEDIKAAVSTGQVVLSGDIPSIWLGIPLVVDEDIIGAIVLQEYDESVAYDAQDIRMLEVAAGQVALAIDRFRKQDALRVLAEELSSANGMKELLLDVITHDLRNPAGVISAVTELLEGDGEINEILRGSSQSLMKVIENATVLSKVTMGESIAKEELDLIQVVKDVVEEFRSQLSTAEMTVNMDLPESFMYMANPIISEIPKNYISNAIKYSPDGKVLRISLKQINGQHMLCFEDYGKAIPEDKKEAIFKRSVQLAEGEKKGRGLGLAIVKRIADEHNAEVGVESTEAGGNCFYLRF